MTATIRADVYRKLTTHTPACEDAQMRLPHHAHDYAMDGKIITSIEDGWSVMPTDIRNRQKTLYRIVEDEVQILFLNVVDFIHDNEDDDLHFLTSVPIEDAYKVMRGFQEQSSLVDFVPEVGE